MQIYYRISNQSYKKPKLPGCSKESCLLNFLNVFDGIPITIIADNCEVETLDMIEKYVKRDNIHRTSFGNAGAIGYAIMLATTFTVSNTDQTVYFVEDDYIHAAGALEAVRTPVADYWTPYDHPDKYGPLYDYGEISKVFKCTDLHWRYTISTTMTFATTIKTLQSDMAIWNRHIRGNHPQDHLAFVDLFNKGKRLACTIPGLAWHTDLTESCKSGKLDIDNNCLEYLKKSGIAKDNIREEVDVIIKNAAR